MMPFFRDCGKKENKKNVTLQVRIPDRKCRPPVKRVLSSTSIQKLAASLTVEAAMVLPLFLFSMVILMMPMKILHQARQVQTALERTGEELSQYGYLWNYVKEKGGDYPDGQKGLADQAGSKASLLYVRKRMEEMVNFEKLESVSFARSAVMEDGETVDLIMDYRMRLPFSVFRLRSVPMTARSCRRAWIGREGRAVSQSGEEELVYIGRSSTRYHKDKNCHYLYNDIRQVPFKEVGSLHNTFGRKYTACQRCGHLVREDSSVFIMPGGEKYHSDKNCSSIVSYVEAVPLSEVRHLGGCSYCTK